MTSKASALAGETVPRYTSYPTAPHFTAAIGGDTYAGWLARLPATATLSLYLHVPYCVELCHYCGCHTKVVRRPEPIENYAQRLVDEVTLLGAAAGGRDVVHIHWGGGTPSLLGPSQLTRLAERIDRLFRLGPGAEHAIELDPRRVTRDVAATLARIGINRASLGVQDFSPHVQQAIGRLQPFDEVAACVAMLREAGIHRINLDLMYGLPQQTTEDVRRSAALAASLDPSRLALFGYAHVPWFKSNQRLIDEAALPGAAARLDQAEAARETLIERGYEAIGLDHFARAGDDLAVAAQGRRLKRNFQGYTTDEADALIGLGASAIGRLPEGFVQNAPDIAGYSRAVAAGRFATRRGIALSPEDRLRGRVIERIMCDFAVDLDAVAAEHETASGGGATTEAFAIELASLGKLAAAGLVEIAGRRITMTEQGRPFVRLAAAAFDAYLHRGEARHSAAV